MATWSKDELRKIAEADDLHISPFREDGVTYGTPTWIWSVAVGDDLYVRAYYGLNSRWYQASVRQKAGRITAADMTKEVIFEPVEGPINDLVDDAYRAKYRGSPYLSSMISARARSATVKVVPRETNTVYSRKRNSKMRPILLALALAMVLSHAACGADNTTTKRTESMKIRLKVQDTEITATLIDSKTTQDFISLLPLTLTMDDLFRREKFGHLPRAISKEGKRTHMYEVGDIAYWSPGPDVAIYYRHDGQEIPDPGIVVIGKVDSGVEAFDVPGSVKVTLDLIK